MKALFSIVGLVLVVFLVAKLVTTQRAAMPTVSGTGTEGAALPTTRAQQEQFKADLQKSMQ